jgi:hypothetical protein
MVGGKDLPATAVCEIMARPLWLADRGSVQDERSRALAVVRPGPAPREGEPLSRLSATYLARLRAGDRERAREAAREMFEVDPSEPLGGLAVAMGYRLAGDASGESVWRGRLRIAYRTFVENSWVSRELAAPRASDDLPRR